MFAAPPALVREPGRHAVVCVSPTGADPRADLDALEFASADEARAFLDFLETQVWPTSPHPTGTPSTSILEPVA